MDIVRNFIHIVGITPGEELPERLGGQMIEFSETETLSIPMDKSPAQNIFQVMIQVEIKSSRRIRTLQRQVVVIDGVKEYKIIYGAKEDSDNAGFLVLRTPFNSFYELPITGGGSGTEEVEVYILDAYFQLLDDRKIYSHLLYHIHIPNEQTRRSTKEVSKYPIVDLTYQSSEKKEKAMEYPISQSVMDEVLVSKELETKDPTIENNGRKSEGPKQRNTGMDIDAEYL